MLAIDSIEARAASAMWTMPPVVGGAPMGVMGKSKRATPTIPPPSVAIRLQRQYLRWPTAKPSAQLAKITSNRL